MSAETPLKVIFVAGAGRSGSTLLDRMLGSVPRVASVGELRHIWKLGLAEDEFCGCGEPFSACPFWARVVREALPGVGAAEVVGAAVVGGAALVVGTAVVGAVLVVGSDEAAAVVDAAAVVVAGGAVVAVGAVIGTAPAGAASLTVSSTHNFHG